MERGRGRPMSLAGQWEEILMELQALTRESVQNELERARLFRQLAAMQPPAGRGAAVAS